MPTNKQRREASRRHLERQLQRRQERAAQQRKTTLILSIAGTLVLIAAIIVTVIALSSGNDKKSTASSKSTGASTSGTPTSAAPTPSPTPSVSYPAASGPAVTFDGVTVKGATDLNGSPGVTSKSATDATKLAVKDLVVGTGAAASPSTTVVVQYTGVLYKNGTKFDSSWSRGMPASFSLAGVVKGFTEGIGGTTGVAPMKVGGRRIMILPATLGYGAEAQGAIPANSSLVFVVDLKSVTA